MSNIVIFNEATKQAKEVLYSVNTPDYSARTDVAVNPDLTLIKTVPLEYIKIIGGALVKMTAAEKAAVDAGKPVPEPDPLIQIKADIDYLKIEVDKLKVK